MSRPGRFALILMRRHSECGGAHVAQIRRREQLFMLVTELLEIPPFHQCPKAPARTRPTCHRSKRTREGSKSLNKHVWSGVISDCHCGDLCAAHQLRQEGQLRQRFGHFGAAALYSDALVGDMAPLSLWVTCASEDNRGKQIPALHLVLRSTDASSDASAYGDGWVPSDKIPT